MADRPDATAAEKSVGTEDYLLVALASMTGIGFYRHSGQLRRFDVVTGEDCVLDGRAGEAVHHEFGLRRALIPFADLQELRRHARDAYVMDTKNTYYTLLLTEDLPDELERRTMELLDGEEMASFPLSDRLADALEGAARSKRATRVLARAVSEGRSNVARCLAEELGVPRPRHDHRHHHDDQDIHRRDPRDGMRELLSGARGPARRVYRYPTELTPSVIAAVKRDEDWALLKLHALATDIVAQHWLTVVTGYAREDAVEDVWSVGREMIIESPAPPPVARVEEIMRRATWRLYKREVRRAERIRIDGLTDTDMTVRAGVFPSIGLFSESQELLEHTLYLTRILQPILERALRSLPDRQRVSLEQFYRLEMEGDLPEPEGVDPDRRVDRRLLHRARRAYLHRIKVMLSHALEREAEGSYPYEAVRTLVEIVSQGRLESFLRALRDALESFGEKEP